MLSGFSELDNLTGGFRKGELTVIAGQPGMGKTTLCWSIGAKLAQSGYNVIMFYSNEGIIDCSVSHKDIFNSGDNLMDIQTPLRLGNMIELIERRKKHSEVDIVFIPHLSFRTQGETEVALSSLRGFTDLYNFSAVIELPVKRTVDNSADRRPRINHIRYPKTVNMIADNILFVYRDDYYCSNDAQFKDFEIIVAKCDAGKKGTARLKIVAEIKRVDVMIPMILSNEGDCD